MKQNDKKNIQYKKTINKKVTNKNNTKKSSIKNKISKFNPLKNKSKKSKFVIILITTFLLGVLLIFSSYAWFYTSLNVNVKFFNLIVSKKNGLYISFDGITYGSSVQISKDTLIDSLVDTYSTNTNQWAGVGLTPVSTNGPRDTNGSKFDVFDSIGLNYRNRSRETRYLSTRLIDEPYANEHNHYIAFDIFLKNITGSPVSDNLFLDAGTSVNLDTSSSNEIDGLVNSIRFGFLKVGSTSLLSSTREIQEIKCKGNCEKVIYEPNSLLHSDLSIERAQKYGVNLVNGEYFPTYAVINPFIQTDIRDTIYGSPKLNLNNFSLQETRTNFEESLFKIPSGVTKVRVYVWIEGQDIDSLETNSSGADISININLIKDTAGYDYYN